MMSGNNKALRQGHLEWIDPGLGYWRTGKHEDFQLLQACELFQAGIGNFRIKKVERTQLDMFGDDGQGVVRDGEAVESETKQIAFGIECRIGLKGFQSGLKVALVTDRFQQGITGIFRWIAFRVGLSGCVG